MSLMGAVWMEDIKDDGLKYLKNWIIPCFHDRDFFKRAPGMPDVRIMGVRRYLQYLHQKMVYLNSIRLG